MRGSETYCPVLVKFCRVVGVLNIITYAIFGDDQLRDLGLVGGQILLFPMAYGKNASVR